MISGQQVQVRLAAQPVADNPCPQQGNVLNIKLSENEEVVQADGVEKKVLVDTYFQMNYGTGEWKRFKKFRDIPAS
nr:hypothetical protein BaRGS_023706 [Batillaria attramentaria]KAG5704826.1 hypothetical protein BaRGS_015209 [Batillaria attramentaria]